MCVGGNYVMKARPWFPDAEVVEHDAAQIAANFTASNYSPPSGARAVACVRLGCCWSAAMPIPGVLDADWAAKLERTIEIFAKRVNLLC